MANVKTRCMFCSMQDSFYLQEKPRSQSATWGPDSIYYLEFDDEQTRGLCGRGNFCGELAVHKKRIFTPRTGWEHKSLESVASDLRNALEDLPGERIAVFLDGSLTLEEAAKAIAFAEKLGTKKIALLPAEDIALGPIDNDFAFDDIDKANTNIIIGDAFTQSPTITRLVHDSRTLGRNHTSITIDQIRCRTGWFGRPELVPPIGETARLLDTLTEAVNGRPFDDIPFDKFGVSADDFGWAVSAIKAAAGNGNIVFAPGWHFCDPYSVAIAAKKLAKAAGMKFGALTIGSNSRGIFRLLAPAGADYIGAYKALYDGSLDAVIAFDCDPVSAMPGSKLPKVFAMTGQLPTEGFEIVSHYLPSTFLFEKRGTLFGTENDFIILKKAMSSPGLISAGDIIDAIAGESLVPPVSVREIIGAFEAGETHPIPAGQFPDDDFIGVGHGHVFHHSDGRYTRHLEFPKLHVPKEIDAAIISPELAQSLGISPDNRITVSNVNGSAELGVIVMNWVDENIILLPMHFTAARALFNFAKNPIGGPVGIKIEKA